MDIFGWIAMLGGLAMFLYGMHLMGEGLQSGGGKPVSYTHLWIGENHEV